MIELLKRFYKPFRLECILGPLSKLIEVVFDLITPLVVMRMIDRGVKAWKGTPSCRIPCKSNVIT